mmetsp:Transcript_4166/g.13051  ORF Transcript_4166/g.13051 Transcript_4166/m.13051 type:complete len:253 (+) Transcript_4166:492-1250(+)
MASPGRCWSGTLRTPRRARRPTSRPSSSSTACCTGRPTATRSVWRRSALLGAARPCGASTASSWITATSRACCRATSLPRRPGPSCRASWGPWASRSRSRSCRRRARRPCRRAGPCWSARARTRRSATARSSSCCRPSATALRASASRRSRARSSASASLTSSGQNSSSATLSRLRPTPSERALWACGSSCSQKGPLTRSPAACALGQRRPGSSWVPAWSRRSSRSTAPRSSRSSASGPSPWARSSAGTGRR